MPNYIIDPTRFAAQGAVIDWITVVRRLGNRADGQRLQPTIQLRWMLRGDMGLPTEPFQVWVRVHNVQMEKQLNIRQQSLMLFFNYGLITWSNGSMARVSVDVQAPSGGSIMAFAGGPLLSNVNAIVNLPTGNTTIAIAAPVIDGLLVSPGVKVTAVRGMETGALAQSAGWTLREVVGLPVTKAAWNGIGKHGDPQGIVGAFMDAPSAAVNRLKRGAPPVGWAPTIATGIGAPLWSPPDFGALVGEVNGAILDQLRGIIAAGFPPNQQVAQRIVQAIPPPQNSSGDTMTINSSNAQVSPLAMLMIAASTDPFLSLALGFGTAYPFTSDSTTVALPRLDFMITARWEKGLDGKSSTPVDYAAIVPAPGVALPPIAPANLVTMPLGKLRPLMSDGDWRSSTRISWDRPPESQLFQNASFAATRVGLAPAEAVVPLMEKRMSGGLRPIAINNNANADPPDPLAWQIHTVDRELPIPANPGSRSVKYAVAVQDLYGQWTAWASIDTAMTQPDPEQVRIVSAKLMPTPPASGSVCPTKLEIEFLWDWRIRRPQVIRFAGRLYTAAEHGSPPPSLVVPAGLDRSLGGDGGFLEVTFAGDTPSSPGATIVGLNESGEQQVPFGTAQGNESRRYRLTLPGVSLDFGLSGHIGLALWAQCQERIAPNRTSAWSDNPCVIATADPRPPIVPIDHVTLASLPDAAGQCHARLSWTASDAIGYFIYESDETQILNASGLPEPRPDQTLDDRLLVLKNAFNARPEALRRNFTRLNETAFTGISRDVTLPKGSAAIHLYVILGVSAGQVEGRWPSGPNAKDALIAISAPRVMQPAPPWLEVQQVLDQTVTPPVFKASLKITTRPGPRVKKIDLHRVRVDDAAKELDTMGPPIARLQTSGSGWTVTETIDPQGTSFITTVAGTDAPPGSWRRVWYRAAAWTAQDNTRGGLPGRSPASTAAWVVIPPPNAPTISPLVLGTGPTAADVIVQWTSPAPLKRTPLGPHTLSVRAMPVGAAIGTPPILSLDAAIDKLGTAPPATGSGVWIVSSTPTLVTYRALIRRVALTDSLRVIVRITDPIGRTGEALATIAAGPVNPAPDLSDLEVRRVTAPPSPKIFLVFKSTAPLEAPLDGPYRVRITAVRRSPVFPPQPPVTLELPLASIPTAPPSGPLPLGLYRLPGSGPTITYVAVTTLSVTQWTVRITAPDGQFAQQTVS